MNGRRLISRWMLFAVATGMLVACTSVPPSRLNEERLRELLLDDSKADDSDPFGFCYDKVTPEVALLVDMGEDALPIIEEAMTTLERDSLQFLNNFQALEIVGGKAAFPIAHKFISKIPDDHRNDEEAFFRCEAMSTWELAPEDVPFTSILKFDGHALNKCLESAAVARRPETLPVLEELLQAMRASAVTRDSSGVEDAYDLVRNGDLEVSSPPDPSEEDQVVYALLRSGVPHIPKWREYGNTQFWDPVRKGYWSRTGRRMDFRAGAAPMEEECAPRITFDVHISPDGRRAAVMLVQFLRWLAAEGTLCILVREGDRWRLHHIIWLWIS